MTDEVQKFLNTISSYEREFKKWEGRVEKILKRYRDDSRDGRRGYTESRFNILWSNVQTLKAATFARLPKPDVSRRFRDNDPVGRVAALILERALDYEISHYQDYRDTLTQSLYDRFLGGRGTAWVRYEPKFTPLENGLDYDGDQVTEDQHVEGMAEQGEMLDYECAPTDYVHWKDFGHSVARTWEEVTCVWRKVYMTRAMLRERFPDIADSIPLDSNPEETKGTAKDGVDKRALIYEIWDKETGKAYWMNKSMNKIIDEKDDPLGLEGFFPCPKPLFATITNETLVPIPDFALYQDQANELDILSDRIDGLIKALQVKGVYDASISELSRLFTEGENNTLLPVTNWAAFAEKQGLKGAIDLVDIQPIAMALSQAYQAMQQVKSQIYDITGISDIVRGQSVASETATAQQIKGQYASLRLKSYQDDVVRYATHLIQLKAQIICKHFDEGTIIQMSGADQLAEADRQFIIPAMQMLKNEPLRSFRIEISSDSMTLADEQQEKQDRIEFLTATSGFMEKAVQASQAAPEIVPLIMELLKFGVTGFRVGKSMEGEIDNTADMLKKIIQQKQMQQQNQPQQPSPEMIKQQSEMQKRQMDAQMENMRIQHDQAMEMMRLNHERQMEANRIMLEKWKTDMNNEVKLLIAEIGARSVITKQQDDAADIAISDEMTEQS